VFVQVATPSRERVDEYRRLRDEIDRLVGRINGDYGRIGRPAISYLHSSYPREEMAALFKAADIMVVTPLRDGMNLVAKEYVACRDTQDGALVLSEFAGAADELKQAFLVNPYDIDGMKQTIIDAIRAQPRDLSRRMRAMRKTVKDHDVVDWAESFMGRLAEVRK
jgi:trehalose 6-phosphate synthase